MLRSLFFAATLLFAVSTTAQETPPSADEVLNEAYAQAQKEKKNVLLIFHASWCGWCHKMDTSLHDKAVKPLVDRYYVTTHLTVHESDKKKHLENPGAIDFLTKLKAEKQGLPYWVILDSKGAVLANSEAEPGENVGCPAAENEVAHFVNVLKKTSSLNTEELEIIRTRFRKNER